MLKIHLLDEGKTACGLRMTNRRMEEGRIVNKASHATCLVCNPKAKKT